MTPELETVALSLSVAKYPVFWSKFSYPSLKSLGGYITNFIERLNFLQVRFRHYIYCYLGISVGYTAVYSLHSIQDKICTRWAVAGLCAVPLLYDRRTDDYSVRVKNGSYL